MDYERIIKGALSKAVNLNKNKILLEKPKNSDFGDYAFPCFSLAGIYKKNPSQIAQEISEKLNKSKIRGISKINPAGPYVNFIIDKNALTNEIISEILVKKGKKPKLKKEKIILEHTSINPNASPHVGRSRNSLIGDSIRRILEFLGHNVETHYYINDISKQIAMLALNFKSKDTFDSLLKKYIEISKKIKENPELEKKVFELLNKFENKDRKTVDLFKKIVDTAIKGQKKIFSSIGITFDYFDYESKYIEPGKNILKELEKTGKLFKDDQGRLVLNQSGTGLDNKMKSPVLVLTRNDGTGLYPLRDLAYSIEKCKKGKNLVVLGEDQKLYFEQFKQALILLKKPYPEVIHYSFILLKDIGKMSTRSGDVVLLEDFISECIKKAQQEINKRKTKGDAKKIAIAAIKYSILKNNNNRNITFDLEEAMNFEGNTGPYLLYSYARASSIIMKYLKSISGCQKCPAFLSIKKAKTKINSSIKLKNLEDKEINLIKKLGDFNETVENARKNLDPSIIANYSFELCQLFNEFYHFYPVINAEKDKKLQRLAIVEGFRIILRQSVDLLGIEVLEEM